MTPEQYRRVASHPLRDVLQRTTNPHRRLPGRRELAQQIAAALPDADEQMLDDVFAKAVDLAKKANGAEGQWQARHLADKVVIDVLDELAADDQLIPAPADDAPPGDETADVVQRRARHRDGTTITWTDGLGEEHTRHEEPPAPDVVEYADGTTRQL